MSVVLVTGGAGYVGSVCAHELISQGHEVVIIDDLSTGHREAVPRQAKFHLADIGDVAAMRSILRQYKVDAVFHFAAKALIPESVREPLQFYEVNVSSALRMLNVVCECGIAKFVFSSTAAVYGNTASGPITEDSPKNPVNSYGDTKLAFERALQWYSSAYGVSAVAFRYFNASGAISGTGERHEPETHIIPLIFEAACGQRDAFIIYGEDYDTPDGTCLRDYVHVLDIAKAHILALENLTSPGFRAYNIGVGKSYSVLEVCSVAEEVIGTAIPLRVGPRRLGDPAVLCADAGRLRNDFGWLPQHSDLHNIVRSAWKWKQDCHCIRSTARVI